MNRDLNLFIAEERESDLLNDLLEAQEEASIKKEAGKKEAGYVQPSLPGFLEAEKEAVNETAKKQAERQHIKRVIEALLFSTTEPLSLLKIREILEEVQPVKPRHVKDAIRELQYEYLVEKRAFKILEIEEEYSLKSCEEYAPYIQLLNRNKRQEKLSTASTEVLAIIAYKQPITRPQIEAIRGVDSSGTLQNLLERELVEPCGKLESAGRPTIYRVTKRFLEHFGLNDLSELPNIS